MIICAADLATINQKLRVYELVQSGWEHEQNVFEANARHVPIVRGVGRTRWTLL
jgi:hypothetical protein